MSVVVDRSRSQGGGEGLAVVMAEAMMYPAVATLARVSTSGVLSSAPRTKRT